MIEVLKKLWNIKFFACLGFVILLGAVAFMIKRQSDIMNKQADIEKSIVAQKQLADDIIRSQSKYVSKEDLDKFAKDNNVNLDVIKKDLSKLNGTVEGINTYLASSPGYHQDDRPSDGVIPRPVDPNPKPGVNPNPTPACDGCDTYGYLKNTQVLNIEEKFADVNVPLGSAYFSAWKAAPWGLTILPREYHSTTVIGVDENDRHYTYNKFIIKADGKEYPVKIQDSQFVEQYPDPHMSWWNPRFSLGISSGIVLTPMPNWSVSPGLYFSPFSYGKTKGKPDWLFAQAGVSYDMVNKTPQIGLSPVMYNLGGKTQYINNTYIGPTIAVGLNGQYSVSATLSITF